MKETTTISGYSVGLGFKDKPMPEIDLSLLNEKIQDIVGFKGSNREETKPAEIDGLWMVALVSYGEPIETTTSSQSTCYSVFSEVLKWLPELKRVAVSLDSNLTIISENRQ